MAESCRGRGLTPVNKPRGHDAAAARLKKIPAFVRGMVAKAVEGTSAAGAASVLVARSRRRSAPGCQRRKCSGELSALKLAASAKAPIKSNRVTALIADS